MNPGEPLVIIVHGPSSPDLDLKRVGVIRRMLVTGTTVAVLYMVLSLLLPFPGSRAVEKSASDLQLKFGAKVARMGSWREAAFRFEKAVKADASNERAFNNLAVARESLGQFEVALEAYRKAVELAPKDKKIQSNYERFMNLYHDLHGTKNDS